MSLNKDEVSPTSSNSPADSGSNENASPENLSNTSDANNAGTSDQQQDAKTPNSPPKDTVELVEQALKMDGKPSAPADPNNPNKQQAQPGAKDSQSKGKDGDAEIPQEFHNHPRWKQLKAQKDDAVKKVETLTKEAESFNQVTDYMETNAIQPAEVAEMLELLALRNASPEEFYVKFREVAQKIEEQFGGVLPQDLQRRVDAGEISQEDAYAFNRSSAIAKMNGAHSSKLRQNQQVQGQKKASEELRTSLSTAANNWEQQQIAADPDYKVKKPFVETRMKALFLEKGWPKTIEEVRAIADQALADVNEQVGAFVPKKTATHQSPSSNRQVQTQAQPKSGRDIVEGVLGLSQ